MRKIKVELFYPGKIISVNHYKFNGRWTKPEAKSWMNALHLLIKMETNKLLDASRKWQSPLRVTLSGRFRNKREQPDLHNLSKVILDTVEDATDVNDKYIRWSDGDATISKALEPMLFITIEEVT